MMSLHTVDTRCGTAFFFSPSSVYGPNGSRRDQRCRKVSHHHLRPGRLVLDGVKGDDEACVPRLQQQRSRQPVAALHLHFYSNRGQVWRAMEMGLRKLWTMAATTSGLRRCRGMPRSWIVSLRVGGIGNVPSAIRNGRHEMQQSGGNWVGVARKASRRSGNPGTRSHRFWEMRLRWKVLDGPSLATIAERYMASSGGVPVPSPTTQPSRSSTAPWISGVHGMIIFCSLGVLDGTWCGSRGGVAGAG